MNQHQYVQIGLTQEQALKLQTQHERNELVGKPPPSDIEFVIRQFQNPLILVLVAAGLITWWLGEYSDTAVIGLAVVVNTVLGFVQERNAQRGLEALQKVLSPQAWVRREGKQLKIDARELVPGDVVLLYEGDKAPADGVIVEEENLMVNEAMLTGESLPVEKNAVSHQSSVISHQFLTEHLKLNTENRVFMGTVVTAGSGVMVVTNIGMATEMGKIAASLEGQQERRTPLEQRLAQLARWLTVIIVLVAAGVFTFGSITGRDLGEMFALAVAVAVAAIPEGLAVALTAILAIGMQRILKKKALVRKLAAAETLGTVTVICVDKTGTLTEGGLEVVDYNFKDLEVGKRAAALANDLRDATEIARWDWLRAQAEAGKLGWVDPQMMVEEYPRDEVIPFATTARFLATRHGRQIFVVGAPEELLEWVKEVQSSKFKVQSLIEQWGQKGRRMIGFGYEHCHSVQEAKSMFQKLRHHKFAETSIHWLGLIAYADPVRPSVRAALEQAEEAGIKVKVITGDYRMTAEAILKELGIHLKPEEVLEGFELTEINDEHLANRVQQVRLFARTQPQQKLRIVNALKANQEIVAMMGDGVNDAPALAAADIGIVVGEASEVAREAADMVLLDSNFATILEAVAEGRGIFDNLRKILLYLLSDTFSEVLVIVGSLLFGWPLAIGAAQILWINLVNDGLPSLALTVDPRDPQVLKRKPIDPRLPLFDQPLIVLSIVASVVSAVVGLVIFGWWRPIVGDEVAQTMVFATLALDSFWFAFSCRALNKNIWEESVTSNLWLVGAVVVGIGLVVLPIQVEWLRALLNLTTLSSLQWSAVLLASVTMVAVVEGIKNLRVA